MSVSEDTVFAADGAPAPPAVRARLGSFRFYRDAIHKLGRRRTRREGPAELDDAVFRGDADENHTISAEFYRLPDTDDADFIESRDSDGLVVPGRPGRRGVRFTGNEGGGEETECACCVLVVVEVRFE